MKSLSNKLLKIASQIEDPKLATSLRRLAKKYGMVSIHQTVSSRVEELLEKAIQRYYDLKLATSDPSYVHWIQELNKQLVNLEKANLNKSWKRGFVLLESELNLIIQKLNSSGFQRACKHLDQYGLDPDEEYVYSLYNKTLSLQDLYDLAGRSKPNYTTKYER